MSILSVDNISPIGSGTSVTVNSAATLVLTNANSTGVITATSFVGNLTGNPTGTLQTAAQPNITSVGTLSGLTVAGNVNCTSGRYQRGSATVQDGDAIAGGININGLDMDASVIMSVFGNDNDFTRISGSKSRNASVGSHTIVQNNDVLLSLKGFGSDGNNFEEAAQIEMQVDGTPNNNVMPGRIVFKTTTTDGVAERLRIGSDGLLTATGNADFNVAGGEFDIYSTGSGDQLSLRLLNSDTTAGNKIGIYFGPCNNVAGAYIKGVAESDFTSAPNRDAGLELGTRLNATFLPSLKVSAAGAVTKPYLPSFHARPPGAYSTPHNTDTIIGGTWSTSDSESFVRGTLANGTSVWNNSTGIFTVPISGIYYFHLSLFLADNTTRRDAQIYLNGTSSSNQIAKTEVMGQSGTGNRQVQVSTVVSLSVNDQIRFGVRNTGSTNTLYTSSKPWSYACGYLIG